MGNGKVLRSAGKTELLLNKGMSTLKRSLNDKEGW